MGTGWPDFCLCLVVANIMLAGALLWWQVSGVASWCCPCWMALQIICWHCCAKVELCNTVSAMKQPHFLLPIQIKNSCEAKRLQIVCRSYSHLNTDGRASSLRLFCGLGKQTQLCMLLEVRLPLLFLVCKEMACLDCMVQLDLVTSGQLSTLTTTNLGILVCPWTKTVWEIMLSVSVATVFFFFFLSPVLLSTSNSWNLFCFHALNSHWSHHS